MKKIGILTLNSNNNFGNKLQNYALKIKLEEIGLNVDTIWFCQKLLDQYKPQIKSLMFWNENYKRENFFENFTRKYLNRKYYKTKKINNLYDYFVVGSDQVWNYKFKGFNNDYFLEFSDSRKNISYAASVGVDKIDNNYIDRFTKGLENIDYISVREEKAKEILQPLCPNKNVEVLIDPTMLLTAQEWDIVMKKPKQIEKHEDKKFILNYFLGEISVERKKEIERIAEENNCFIINILDKEDPFYKCGPSEFLYLEKNAFLICTDSFHSSVFAILYNTPFVVFDREQNGVESMNSRIDTLLSKFCLEDRKFNKKITKTQLKCNYTKAYKILEEERKKALKFLKTALDIEE